MYSSTKELKKLFSPSDLFINNDIIYCPITSHLIKATGCVSGYSGDTLSLNQNNDTLAKTNNKVKIVQTFCIETRNKD